MPWNEEGRRHPHDKVTTPYTLRAGGNPRVCRDGTP